MWSNAGWQSDEGGWYKNKASGGGGGVSVAFKGAQGNASVTNNNTTAVTFASFPIGVTSTSDVIVLVVDQTSSVLSSVTMTDGGSTVRTLSAVSGAAVSDSISKLQMFYLTGFVMGSTTSVVLNGSVGILDPGISGYVISGTATPTPNAGINAALSGSDPLSLPSTAIPSGGVMIAAGSNDANITAPPWTNATSSAGDVYIHRDPGDAAHILYTAHTALGTGASVAVSTSGFTGNNTHMIAGIWAP